MGGDLFAAIEFADLHIGYIPRVGDEKDIP